MSVGESAKKHPAISITLGIILVGAAIAVAWWQRGDGSAATSAARGVPLAWFTVDDGKTWFAADARRLPPFEHDGKTAYRCEVYTADGGKTKFVSHLERYPEAVKRKLESLPAEQQVDAFEARMLQVKPPGTGERGWVDIGTPEGMAIRTPRAPAGGDVTPVWPE